MKEQIKSDGCVMPHVISLSERQSLTISGVTDVDSFDDMTIVVHTSLGELTVKGNRLHISHLNIESGDLVVEGTVESLTYAELRTHSGGFFGKLFR